MSWAFLLIHDRPEYKELTLASAREKLPEPDVFIEVDDTEHKLGFAGAIQEGWERCAHVGVDYVFHCEGDFTFNVLIPIYRMAFVLERNPHLAQLALKRQAWSEPEKAAGGLVEAAPKDYAQRTQYGDVWTEHRRFWTTNPSLFPVGFCYQGWPQVERSEGIFTHRLLEDPEVQFGYWGAKFDAPRVTHIGDVRSGHGY